MKMACRDDADLEPPPPSRAPTPLARRRSGPDGPPSALEGHRAQQQHVARGRVRRPDRSRAGGARTRPIPRRVPVARRPASATVSLGQAALGRPRPRRAHASAGETRHGRRARKLRARADGGARRAHRPDARAARPRPPARSRARCQGATKLPGPHVVSPVHGRARRPESPRAPRSPGSARRPEPLERRAAGVRHAARRPAVPGARADRRREPEAPAIGVSRAPGVAGLKGDSARSNSIPSRMLRGGRLERRAARDARDHLATGPRRPGDGRAVGAARASRRSISSAHLHRRPPEGREGRDDRKPPHVSLRALSSRRYQGRARAGARAAAPDDRRHTRRADRFRAGRPGLSPLAASLDDPARPALDEGRRALLVQLRGPRGVAVVSGRVLRTARRERLSRSDRSAPAGTWGILQSLRESRQHRRVVARGHHHGHRSGADHRGDPRRNGMDEDTMNSNTATERLRVAIVGAGPSGAALGILLARAGGDVTLFDDGRHPPLLVGESLVPAVVPILRRLGFEEETAGFSRVKPGVSFIWSPTHRVSVTFDRFVPAVFPYAYNIPRPQFDQALLAKALAAGVRHVPVKARFETGNGNGSGAELTLAPETLAAAPGMYEHPPHLVVDATGRARHGARALSIGAKLGPRKDVAHFAHFENFNWDDVPGQVLIARGQAGGWSWCIPLQDRLSIGIVLDQADAAKLGRTPEERLECAIATDPWLFSIGGGAKRMTDVATYATYQLISERGYGRGWVMLGDAFGFIDPMLSPGVFLALRSAELLADGLAPWLERKAAPTPDEMQSVLAAYSAAQTEMLSAWFELVAYLYDGRLAALMEAGKHWMAPNAGFFKKMLQGHIGRQVGRLASGAATTSRYSRGLLRFLGRHGMRGIDPKKYVIR